MKSFPILLRGLGPNLRFLPEPTQPGFPSFPLVCSLATNHLGLAAAQSPYASATQPRPHLAAAPCPHPASDPHGVATLDFFPSAWNRRGSIKDIYPQFQNQN
jgi:hypothetical protein